MEFPATLYRRGTEFVWDGERFDALVVHSDADVKKALDDGWCVGKPPADEPQKPRRGRSSKAGE